ncbi:MAG: NAD-dependent epimerase/dehydratase family protein [Tepidisphaeraceae bacterium]
MTQGTIVVTGGTGKAGRAVIRDLLDHGYRVINVDQAKPQEPLCPFVAADLTDYGQAVAALSRVDGVCDRVDGVVHLAAIPAPGMFTNAVTFQTNMLSTYNVFEACRCTGVKQVVWASSETVLGLPFDVPPPYVPVDEDYPGRPESAYSLSKLLGEQMAEQFCRWDPTMKIIGLRFSNIMEPADYAKFEQFTAKSRKWNLWGYIDARDAAQAVRKSLEYAKPGADVFVIANSNTVMQRPNEDLLNEIFPGVPRKRSFRPHETLLSIDKAKRLLGYEPQHDWSAK